MECRKCHKEMMLEEYETIYQNNDEEICLREEFWCPTCDLTEIKRTYYKKVSEEYV